MQDSETNIAPEHHFPSISRCVCCEKFREGRYRKMIEMDLDSYLVGGFNPFEKY